MSDALKIFELYSEALNQEPQMTVDENGSKFWMINGQLHREDGPAIEFVSGSKMWYSKGRLHRIDAPAIIYANGHKEWYNRGRQHRLNGPAVEAINGEKQWWVSGQQFYNISDWARAALKYEDKSPTQEAIDAKIAEAMQQDLFA
jgi:hypothetical protein